MEEREMDGKLPGMRGCVQYHKPPPVPLRGE
jgi:hypothetical protein